MKKLLILTLLSLFISSGMYAQKNKRTSAYMYNKNKQYEKAMLAINEAILHPKTENDAKTWMYRGIIYYNIANDTSAAINAIEPNAPAIAVESFKKSKELDEKGALGNETALYLINLTNIFYQKGADGFRAEDFNVAIDNFKQAFEISQMDGRFDTVAAFNVGMSGVYSEQPEIAAEYMSKCLDVNYKDARVYLYYARAEKALSDTTKAFEILEQGRSLYPTHSGLQLEEAQLYLETGRNEKLIKSLIGSIENDPTNANLYRVLGGTYEKVGDEESALTSYKKAIEINPDFKDAIFNIGAIYVNRASNLYTEANDLPFDEAKKYDELKGQAADNLKEALPYLEKSLSFDPEDAAIIVALNEAYRNLKMDDKLSDLLPNLKRAYTAQPDDNHIKGALLETYKVLKMTDEYKELMGS